MKDFLFRAFMVLCSVVVSGQTEVTFQLDLENLIHKGYFSPDSGDRVLVRGSFNSWEGDVHELTAPEGSGLYSGSFPLEQAPGDTIPYKFVIRKDPQRYFWEHQPDPENPPHGNRLLILDHGEQILESAEFRYNEYMSFPVVFPRKKLQEDYLQFRKILVETHPALYDYTGKSELDSLFDSNYVRIDSSMEFREFLLLMTGVISKVGCGHSSMWIPGAFWNVAPPKLFPLKLHLSNEKSYTTGAYLDPCEVPAGSEIIAINGTPMPLIVEKLTSLQSADGFNRSYRLAKAGQHFSVKYSMAFGFPDSFIVEYLGPGASSTEYRTVRPVSKDRVDQAEEVHDRLSLEIPENGHAALLTVNTFGYYGEVDWFKSFLDSTFLVLSDREIENLILDLRGNSGGDPFCASYLWAYLQPEPLPYFEEHYGRYDTLANPVPVPENHFSGRLFTLIDGHGFSTTGHFCGLLKYHGVGKFIGTELGSTYTCTGNATYPALNHTGIMVGTARVRRYTAAVKNMNPRQGIIPDYTIKTSQQDILDHRDAALEFALKISSQ